MKKFFPCKFNLEYGVPLLSLSYSCMFQVEICSQELEICKSVCMFIVLAIALWRLINFQLFCSDDCRSWPREEKINNHGCEVSTHTFLTMIIEESVCFMSCEPIFFAIILNVVHTEYIISLKEFKSWVTRISFALLPGWQNYLLSNILRFALKICFWNI